MAVVLFDTHAFVKKLTAVGVPEAQAKVLAQEQARLNEERLAAKLETSDLAQRTRDEFTEVAKRVETLATRADVEQRISEAKAEILKWVVGAIGLQTIVILGGVCALLMWFR